MTQMTQPTVETMSFEQAYHQLEEMVRQLEAGNLPLQQVIALYQEGMALVQYCNAQLDEAELSVKTLTLSGSLVDFEEM